MRILLTIAAAALALASVPAHAQGLFVPQSIQAIDTTQFATASDIAAARAAADAAVATANAASTTANAAQNALPPTCASVPPGDTATGSVGTSTACVRRQDASSKSTVMPATALTLSDGTFSGTWPGTFASAPTTAFASIKLLSSPYICQVSTATTTSFSGKCWQIISNTLPGVATSLLNLIVTPYTNATAGLTVMVVGRQ